MVLEGRHQAVWPGRERTRRLATETGVLKDCQPVEAGVALAVTVVRERIAQPEMFEVHWPQRST